MVGGEFATVMDYFWREDAPWLVLQLPDGRRAVAPVLWTDLPDNTFPSNCGCPLLLAPALLSLTRVCQRLLPSQPKKRRSPK
jgi:hypothetical protein